MAAGRGIGWPIASEYVFSAATCHPVTEVSPLSRGLYRQPPPLGS